MALTLSSGTLYTGSSSDTDSDLKSLVDANPSIGMYEPGACILRNATLNISDGHTLSIRDGAVLVFNGPGSNRVTGAGTLNFNNGGGITYNGNVGHSFFNVKLNGNNIVYRINANVAGGRSDFFRAITSTDGLKNLTLVCGKGASAYSVFTHLENFANKIEGLKFVNDVQVPGVAWIIQFGAGTYADIEFPELLSKYNVSLDALTVYVSRSGGNGVLARPVFPHTSVKPTLIRGDAAGGTVLLDERWSNYSDGVVGKINLAGSASHVRVSRDITFHLKSLFDSIDPVYVKLSDSAAASTVYHNGQVTATTSYALRWADCQTGGFNEFTSRYPFKLVARRWNMIEHAVTYDIAFNPANETYTLSFGKTPYSYVTELKLDVYATTKVVGLVDTTFNEGLKTITVAADKTLDVLYDEIKYWLTQNLQVTNFLSPFGTTLDIGDWGILQTSGSLTGGQKMLTIKSSVAIGASGAGVIDVPVIDIAGDSYIQEATGAHFKVYASETERDSRTNPLAENVNIFRFNFAQLASPQLFLWIASGAVEVPASVQVSPGSNSIDLGVAAQLLAIPARVWSHSLGVASAAAIVQAAKEHASVAAANTQLP